MVCVGHKTPILNTLIRRSAEFTTQIHLSIYIYNTTYSCCRRKQLLSAADEKSSRSKLSTIDKTLTSDRTAAANENVGRAGLIYQSNETIESKAQVCMGGWGVSYGNLTSYINTGNPNLPKFTLD